MTAVHKPRQHESPQAMVYHGECEPERALAAAVVQRAVYDASGIGVRNHSGTGLRPSSRDALSWLRSARCLPWIAVITPEDREPDDIRQAIMERMGL